MLALLHAAIGLVLGWLRPSWGLAVLIGAVAVSSSLWWQLGLVNTAAPLAYLLGYLSGWGARSAVGGDSDGDETGSRVPGKILLAASLTVTFTLLATLLAVLRRHPAQLLVTELRSKASLLLSFNPPGLPGELQAALTAMAGPLLLISSIVVLRSRPARTLVRRAFACGAAFAVLAPALQLLLLLDSWVRPDKGEYGSTGLVGFFQDPHSYAAYLLLVIGFAMGMSWGCVRAARTRAAILHGLLAGAAILVLVGTNSKTGLVALAAVVIVLITVSRLEGRRSPDVGVARSLMVPAALLAMALAVVVGLTLSPGLRQATYEGLRGVGARRLAQPFAPEVDWKLLLGDRPTRWSRSAAVIAQRPLWGAGPMSVRTMPMGAVPDPGTGAMRTIPPENTHNYFLQFAAEYGIPAMLAFVWLIGTMLASMWANAFGPSTTHRSMVAGILSGVIGFLLFSIVSHPMLLAECQAVFWTTSGLAIASGRDGSA